MSMVGGKKPFMTFRESGHQCHGISGRWETGSAYLSGMATGWRSWLSRSTRWLGRRFRWSLGYGFKGRTRSRVGCILYASVTDFFWTGFACRWTRARMEPADLRTGSVGELFHLAFLLFTLAFRVYQEITRREREHNFEYILSEFRVYSKITNSIYASDINLIIKQFPL